MIQLQLNKRDFEYDIYSLIKSFYPGKDVTVVYGEEDGTDAELKISVFYEENQITISVFEDGALILTDSVSVCYEENRKETKNALKRLAYEMLRNLTGTELPWGDLTGIRPTRFPWLFWNRDGKMQT